MGDKYIVSDDNKKLILIGATNSYGHSISQMLPCDEIEMWHDHPDFYLNRLEESLKIPDDFDIGYFIEVDLIYPDEITEKTKHFHFVLKKFITKDNFN